MSRTKKRTHVQAAKERPVVMFMPPKCPHCGCQGYVKQRGAKLVQDHQNGRVSYYFTVRCKECSQFYRLREVIEK